MYAYELNKLIEKGIVKKVLKLPKNPLYLKGETFWCGYWLKYYTVLDASYVPVMGRNNKVFMRLKEVKIQWSDGKISTHCTELDPLRDYRLILN